MAESTDVVFEPITDLAEVRKLTTKARTREVDQGWAERIGTLTLGQAFNTVRPETETVRQFKKRLNAAAAASYRSLDWTTQDPKQPEGVEPKRFLARIKAIDANAQKEALAASSANGTAQTGNGTAETSEAAQQRRR